MVSRCLIASLSSPLHCYCLIAQTPTAGKALGPMGPPTSFKVEIISARLAANDHAAAVIECHIMFRGECKSSHEIPCQTSSDIEINFTSELLMSESQSEEVEDDWHAIIYITSRPSTSTPGSSGYRQLMARAFLDLRLAQVHDGDFLSVEIFHCFDLTDGLESGTAGVLFVRLCTEGYTRSEEHSADLILKIQGTQNQINYEMHQNFQAMRILWAKARKNHPYVENRPMIKLIAEDECGQNRICCDFVRPIYPPRSSQLANGPRFASRFVSLIPFNRLCSLSGGRRESWLPAQAMLLRRSGDIEDHANLLCSLLLGWGMNAFVCSGCIRSSFSSTVLASDEHTGSESSLPHYWVVTLDTPSSALFWEPLSGQQFEIPLVKNRVELNASSRRGHPFLSIAVLFRHDSYLLNVQPSSLLQHTRSDTAAPSSSSASFDISDKKSWVELLPSSSSYAVRLASADAGASVRRFTGHPATHTSLTPSDSKCHLDITTDSEVSKLEEGVERDVRAMLVSWREEEGMGTRFDEQLSIILQPALFAYEYERVMGVTASSAAVTSVDCDFQGSIRQYVGKGQGQCFKGFPTCFSSLSDIPSIKRALAQSAAARDVVFTPETAGATRYAVRAKVFPYPAGVFALWVMVAVRFDAN